MVFPGSCCQSCTEAALATSYFLSEEDKSPQSERLCEGFESPMLEAYLLFYQFSLKVFIKLSLLLQ